MNENKIQENEKILNLLKFFFFQMLLFFIAFFIQKFMDIWGIFCSILMDVFKKIISKILYLSIILSIACWGIQRYLSNSYFNITSIFQMFIQIFINKETLLFIIGKLKNIIFSNIILNTIVFLLGFFIGSIVFNNKEKEYMDIINNIFKSINSSNYKIKELTIK